MRIIGGKDKKNYDFLIVGAGVFGATVAERLASFGYRILVIDKRMHLAGNCYSYTDDETGIEVHKFGSHIFHTNSDRVWNYIKQFTEFNDYVHTVNTRFNNKLYPMPINLDTINLLYKTNMTSEKAKEFIEIQARRDLERLRIKKPRNFEEKAISLVGEKLYNAFLKGYTEKQWGRSAKFLSADILKRIPVRFSVDNRYFVDAKHQGIPKLGYTKMVEKMLGSDNIDVELGVCFKEMENKLPSDICIVYCGQVDELMDYRLGVLPWRSLRFETRVTNNSLGQAVVNEADKEVAFTRTHDYKYYQVHCPEIIKEQKSIIMREYPMDFKKGSEAYYPVNNNESKKLYDNYKSLIKRRYPKLVLGGRLGTYRYWDMDNAVLNALELASTLLSKKI